MSQHTTAHDNQNYHQSAPSNKNNNLHRPPPIINLESDNDDNSDDDVVLLETVHKTVRSLPQPPPAVVVCLVKAGGQLDYHDDCLCVKCRMIKQFLAKIDNGEASDCDCVECRQNAAAVGDQQNSQIPNEEKRSQEPLDQTNNAEPQSEALSTENDDNEEEEEDILPARIYGQFQCLHCPKSFSEKYRFVRHVIIHSDKKPFGCSRCPFKSNRESSVANHYRNMHSGRRLYRCAFAGCGFSNSVYNDICVHIRTKHRTVLEHHASDWKKVIGKYVLKRYLASKKK